MLLLDTEGTDMWEDSQENTTSTTTSFTTSNSSNSSHSHKMEEHVSHRNVGEAKVVLEHVLYLLNEALVPPSMIGVITPYNAQVISTRSTRTKKSYILILQLSLQLI